VGHAGKQLAKEETPFRSGLPMSYGAESAAARLWRDKAEVREQERNEARAQARISEEKVAILTAENHRLASENARLRAQISAHPVQAEAETEMQMEALRAALIPLLAT
jgi:hypothetical protein